MFTLLESGIITLTLSQNYDSYISRQLLNSFKTLTKLSLNLEFGTFKTYPCKGLHKKCIHEKTLLHQPSKVNKNQKSYVSYEIHYNIIHTTPWHSKNTFDLINEQALLAACCSASDTSEQKFSTAPLSSHWKTQMYTV